MAWKKKSALEKAQAQWGQSEVVETMTIHDVPFSEDALSLVVNEPEMEQLRADFEAWFNNAEKYLKD